MGLLAKLLGTLSGNKGVKVSEQLLFDKVIGFRGVTAGCGTSTIVQNVAIAISEKTDYSICILDTAYMYPTQYPMLVNKAEQPTKDLLDFSGELSDIVTVTNYRGINLVSLSNRFIADMLSATDNEVIVDKVIGALKSYFDVILVDLTYELTNINTYSAIKCNRIFNVTDQSLKSVYHLRKSINSMVTLAVPVAKANHIIINKVVPDVLSNTAKVAEEAGLKVVGEIPLSYEIAKLGVTGKRVYASKTTDKDIFAFSSVIDSVANTILQVTPLNEKYLTKNNKNGATAPTPTIDEDEIEFSTTTDVKALKREAKEDRKSGLFNRKTQPKAESKPEPQSETKVTAEPKGETKLEPKPEAKPESKPKAETQSKPTGQVKPTNHGNLEAKPSERQPQKSTERQPQKSTQDATQNVVPKSETKPVQQQEQKPVPKPLSKPTEEQAKTHSRFDDFEDDFEEDDDDIIENLFDESGK